MGDNDPKVGHGAILNAPRLMQSKELCFLCSTVVGFVLITLRDSVTILLIYFFYKNDYLGLTHKLKWGFRY